MANDAIDLIIDNLITQSKKNKELFKMINSINRDEKYVMIRELLNPYIGDLMVTPKEIDTLIDDAAKIIANGINISLHSGIGLNDINRYIH
jgi:spore protease